MLGHVECHTTFLCAPKGVSTSEHVQTSDEGSVLCGESRHACAMYESEYVSTCMTTSWAGTPFVSVMRLVCPDLGL